MIDPVAFDALIRDVEDRVLSAFFTHSYRSAAAAALAHGLLREAAAATAPEDGNVMWLALISPPFAPDAWCVVSVTEGVERGTPLEVLAPDRPAQRVRELGEELSKGPGAVSLGRASVMSRAEFGDWSLIDGVGDVFATYVRVTLGPDRPGIEGVLLVAVERPLGSAVTELSDAVEHACGCLRDRLRLAYAAETTSVRVLASVDDMFQQELARAREALGLRDFLVALDTGVASSGSQTSLHSDDGREPVLLAEVYTDPADDEGLRMAFETALTQLQPNGLKTVSQLRVGSTSGPSLITPIGRWLGWCEYRYGLLDLKSRAAVLTVARDPETLNRAIARFLRHSQGKDAGLVVLIPSAFHSTATTMLAEWRDICDISLGLLQ